MPLNTRHYTDLDLNFTLHPIKGDVNILTDDDAVIQSVKDLIFTNHYDFPFHPEIGSSITNLLFENMTPLTQSNIQLAIQEVLTNFEPRVTIQSIVVSAQPDQNAYNVTLTFFINNSALPVTIDMILELLR
jgi:uncharacterized protein